MTWKTIFVALLFCSPAFADSSVFLCRLREQPDEVVVRLKKYFDATEKMTLGKIERVRQAEVVESTHTKVYQIPIFEKDYYIQLWFSDQVSVEAQLNYDQARRPFSAIFKKKSQKINLICNELFD